MQKLTALISALAIAALVGLGGWWTVFIRSQLLESTRLEEQKEELQEEVRERDERITELDHEVSEKAEEIGRLSDELEDARAQVQEAADSLRQRVGDTARVGIILGTGLGKLAEEIEARETVPYDEIPHFPLSTVESHDGRLIAGTLRGVEVLAMQGRLHLYEGYSAWELQRFIDSPSSWGVVYLSPNEVKALKHWDEYTAVRRKYCAPAPKTQSY